MSEEPVLVGQVGNLRRIVNPPVDVCTKPEALRRAGNAGGGGRGRRDYSRVNYCSSIHSFS